MVNKTVKTAAPMMYIVQPKFKITHINNMQETYKTTQKESQSAEVQTKANEGLFPNFEKLNIEEKIELLLNLPDQGRKRYVQIITEDGVQKGIIKDFEQGNLFLNTENIGDVKIILEEVIDIQCI